MWPRQTKLVSDRGTVLHLSRPQQKGGHVYSTGLSAELNEIVCRLIYSGRKQASDFLGQLGGRDGQKRAQESFWGNGNVLDLDYSGFMSGYIC